LNPDRVAIAEPGPLAETKQAIPAAWVDRKQLAKHLAVSQRTIANWMARRRIPYLKLGRTVRFSIEQVDEHLRRTQTQGW